MSYVYACAAIPPVVPSPSLDFMRPMAPVYYWSGVPGSPWTRDAALAQTFKTKKPLTDPAKAAIRAGKRLASNYVHGFIETK